MYPKLITKKNIFRGWKEFLVGKKKKKDVIIFQSNLEENLSNLYTSLKQKTYRPGGYTGFYVRDPKIRLIHKATVSDRVVHHIVSIVLEIIYEQTFYAHSYSCRKNKGTHRGVIALQKMALKASRNNTRTCWALKCDVKKFFASVNQQILFEILNRRIKDKDFLDLLHKIINSFYSDRADDLSNKKGIPIGNLTSQLFSNIYLDDLDQFIKHKLKVKYYIRYADDFVFLSHDKNYLENLVTPVKEFLKKELDLELHPDKILFKKLVGGIDFLGYIIFPYHILPRTKTKRRLIKKIRRRIKEYKRGKITEDILNQTIQSYLGYLTHANTYKFKQKLQNLIWFWLTE
ncbi:MAG: Retron-type reverse transcriptase [Candidatus Daviesbacteria bacterium GW2011_GWB1_41_5]|uniref:Retron-type reverse transcriptase n=1 Tax=Candidatus Daviesbacteria bacterium GW2011_GWB1_41_5 TaxID=1618429 RepID=A0A0G0WNA0_9BACT|nr:MAG: Retron-type reverse transcriptase [Candidatus Daviesbacteria bacterium GW2011_GWB1_41_5]